LEGKRQLSVLREFIGHLPRQCPTVSPLFALPTLIG
jgi:hypothetical protein